MRKLKITIDGGAKEIADLVLALQDRQGEPQDTEATAAAIRDILLEFAESGGTRPEPVPEKGF